jgi:hypothetical protein
MYLKSVEEKEFKTTMRQLPPTVFAGIKNF